MHTKYAVCGFEHVVCQTFKGLLMQQHILNPQENEIYPELYVINREISLKIEKILGLTFVFQLNTYLSPRITTK